VICTLAVVSIHGVFWRRATLAALRAVAMRGTWTEKTVVFALPRSLGAEGVHRAIARLTDTGALKR
jgi:hypothetical protein